MRTINQTLTVYDTPLGHFSLWANDVMGRLDKLRVWPKQHIPVTFTPSEYVSDNGRKWHCLHAAAYLDYVAVGHDESEMVPICDDCHSQLINGEWIND